MKTLDMIKDRIKELKRELARLPENSRQAKDIIRTIEINEDFLQLLGGKK